jgi:hypothetical protein
VNNNTVNIEQICEDSMLAAGFRMLGARYPMLGADNFLLGAGFGMLNAKTTDKKSNQELFLFF